MPETGVVPCVKVKVEVLSVKGFIASVKNTPILVLVGTSVAPFALLVNVTPGLITSDIGVVVVVVVVLVVVCVVVFVVVCVVVAVVVVVALLQAEDRITVNTMMIDITSVNMFFLFI